MGPVYGLLHPADQLLGLVLAVHRPDVANEPGALSIVLDCLAREDVFIEYMYAFSDGDTARVVIRPTDLDRCIEILTRCKCNLLNRDNLSQK